jgi:PAS domain S-box-containing protein
VVPEVSEESFRDAIRATGPEPDASTGPRILEVTTLERAYSTRQGFVVKQALEFWRDAHKQAKACGFSGLRGTIQAARAPLTAAARAHWINYEHCLTQLLQRIRGRVLCLYARSIRPPEMVRDALRAHAAVAYRGSIGKNLFHVPPGEYAARDAARLEVDRMLEALEGFRRADARSQSRTGELQRAKESALTVTVRHDSEGRRAIQTLNESLKQLQRKEQQLRRYVDYLTLGQQLTRTGSWAWNRSSGQLFWSREHFRIFGLDPNHTTVSDRLLFGMIHPKERARVKQAFEAALQTKRDFEEEYRIIRPDRSVVHIQTRGRPVFGKRGDVTKYVGTVVDVTERRDGEDSLGSMQSELARASRAITLGQLMASIAHEVNQPLTALIANANASLRWLNRKEPRIDKTRQALARIVSDGNRASEIITRIRGLIRKTDAKRSPLDLNSTVREVLALLRTELRRQNIMVRTNLAENLPLVSADRVQMQQVLLNLVMNAIEAMSSVSLRRRQLTLVTAAEMSSGVPAEIVVSVKDRGIGFHERVLERMFEPFYSNKPHGMGIGLAISRSIAEAHGGSLQAVPIKGWGAMFQFRMPVPGVL